MSKTMQTKDAESKAKIVELTEELETVRKDFDVSKKKQHVFSRQIHAATYFSFSEP